MFESCVLGSFSDEVDSISQKELFATTLVLSGKNKDNKFNSISGLEMIDEDTILTFYPNVTKNKYMELKQTHLSKTLHK